jgi:hypothetical protein
LVTFKVTITQDARPGPRDLELDVSGVPSRLVNAFKVL